MSKPLNRCPLCGDPEAIEGDTHDLTTIWSSIEASQGVVFDPETVATLSPNTTIRDQRCRSCDLVWFHGAMAGDGAFYGQLMGASEAGYYEDDRFEFGVVAKQLDFSDSVLDLGCGRGDFLKSIQSVTSRVAGVETSALASDLGRRDGLEIFASAGEASREGAKFSVVTMFQILEHLPSIEPFVDEALECLMPGGRLFVSVPTRDRFSACVVPQPLDHPPHHLSRWSAEQFQHLASQFGLELRNVWSESLSVRSTLGLLRLRVSSNAISTGLAPPAFSWRAAIGSFRKGHTIAAELQLPM